jgi:hypothetical protein
LTPLIATLPEYGTGLADQIKLYENKKEKETKRFFITKSRDKAP